MCSPFHVVPCCAASTHGRYAYAPLRLLHGHPGGRPGRIPRRRPFPRLRVITSGAYSRAAVPAGVDADRWVPWTSACLLRLKTQEQRDITLERQHHYFPRSSMSRITSPNVRFAGGPRDRRGRTTSGACTSPKRRSSVVPSVCLAMNFPTSETQE